MPALSIHPFVSIPKSYLTPYGHRVFPLDFAGDSDYSVAYDPFAEATDDELLDDEGDYLDPDYDEDAAIPMTPAELADIKAEDASYDGYDFDATQESQNPITINSTDYYPCVPGATDDIAEANLGPYVRDENGRFAESDGLSYFNREAVERAADQSPKSRELLVLLSPDDFLKMAAEFEPSPDKTARVKGLLEQGVKFETIPHLRFEHDGEGSARVTSHEGRHRATALKELGIQTMPVVLLSGEGGKGYAIRWGDQDQNPIRGDWPKWLHGQRERGTEAIRFPVPDMRAQSGE